MGFTDMRDSATVCRGRLSIVATKRGTISCKWKMRSSGAALNSDAIMSCSVASLSATAGSGAVSSAGGAVAASIG